MLNKTIPEGDEQQCFTCGECFTNWDRILSEMNDRTKIEVDKAQQLNAQCQQQIPHMMLCNRQFCFWCGARREN